MQTRLFLLSKLKPGFAYEVMAYDPVEHKAVLRDASYGLMTDINFHIDIIKRCYTLTDVEPECLKRKST